jgi:transposase-like protein
MRTSTDAAAKALQCLLEGCSIRSTERLTGLNRNTIMRLLIVAGERSAELMNPQDARTHAQVFGN